MMDIITVLLGIAVVAFLYHLLIKWKDLPPGPWNLPVIGYLPWLDAKAPYLSLTQLAEKFGPIYGLYLGSVYTVVVSDVKIVKKIFNMDAASGRAPLYLTHGIMNGYGLICAQGELWKDQRKFVYGALRSFGASKIGYNRKSMEEHIVKHATDLVQDIKEQGDAVVLDPLNWLRHSLGSVINQYVFGASWAKDDETWQWLLHLQEEGTKQMGVAGPLNFLPFLRFLPKFRQTMDFLIDGKIKTHQVYQKLIDKERELMYGPARQNDHLNLIQAFLEERTKRKDSEDVDKFYNDQQFYHLLADVFGASLDTTLTTLRWYLLYLAVNRDVQDKVRHDLRQVLDTNAPTLDDLPLLPYVEASIAEVQRIRSVVPVGIPHGSLHDIDIEGYKIPKSAMIIPLQWAIHMDRRLWEAPESFRPDRFINEEGKFFKPESFIPFQTGKRMCVGDELARMLLYLFGSIIVQNFDISCEAEEADLSGDCGITLTPKPHKLTFRSIKTDFCLSR